MKGSIKMFIGKKVDETDPIIASKPRLFFISKIRFNGIDFLFSYIALYVLENIATKKF
jgi:hypothetical protein